jgi:hypothetical protein
MYAQTASPRRIEDVIMNRSVLRYVFCAGLEVATRIGVRIKS